MAAAGLSSRIALGDGRRPIQGKIGSRVNVARHRKRDVLRCSTNGRSVEPNGRLLREDRSSMGTSSSSSRSTSRSTTTSTSSTSSSSEFEGRWRPLDRLIWQGAESDAMARGTDPIRHTSWASVSPPWKVMLLSDGSVTRHLSLLTDLDVDVDCIEMRNIGQEREGLPEGAELLEGPLVQRQVFLRGHNRQAHVYAASWWNAEEVNTYLSDRKKPIWVSLSEGRTELYREIRSLYYGHSEELERKFGCQGPFWGRHYIFWHNGKPLTLIYEVFSLSLELFLGPCSLVTADEDPESSIDDDSQ